MSMTQVPQLTGLSISPNKGHQLTQSRSHSTLPHAIGQGTMAMARINAGMEPPRQETPGKMQVKNGFML